MMRTRTLVALLATGMLAAALAGWASGQDAPPAGGGELGGFQPIGTFGDSGIVMEGQVNGTTRHLAVTVISATGDAVIYDRDIAGVLQDGRVLIEERSIRAVSKEEAQNLLGSPSTG